MRKLAPRYIVATGLSLLTLKEAKATAIATISKVKEVLGDHHPTFRAKWLLASPTNLSERGPAIYTGTATIMITDTDEDHGTTTTWTGRVEATLRAALRLYHPRDETAAVHMDIRATRPRMGS